MSVIATASIRITGEIGDLQAKLAASQRQLDAFGGAHQRAAQAGQGHAFALGRVERAAASFVGQMVGANRVTEALSVSLGGMAAGGALVTGVLLGLTAIGAAYDLITRGAKKAREEQEKLTTALGARFLPQSGPRSVTNTQYNAARQQQADAMRHLGFLQSSTSELGVAKAYTAAGEAAPFRKRADEINAVTESLRQANVAIGDALVGSVTKMQTVTTTARDMVKVLADAQKAFEEQAKSAIGVFDNLATHGAASGTVNRSLIADYNKVAAQIRNMGDEATPAKLKLLELRDALMANLVVAQAVAAANATGSVGPLVGKVLPGMSLTPDLSPRYRIGTSHMSGVGLAGDTPPKTETDIERNTRLTAERQKEITSAIQGSAAQIASVVGNAVLAIGSGRGAQIGAALGGAAAGGVAGLIGTKVGRQVGGYAGAALGSVIPVVGTLIGAAIGGWVGGLFDHHKKAVDNNTQAVRALTAAMLQNTPSGFKIESYRYSASDAVKQRQQDYSRYKTRGGPRLVA